MVRRTRETFGRLQEELQQERLVALTRISRHLDQLLCRLAELQALLEGDCGSERARLRDAYVETRAEAKRYRWYLEVQREANGLLRHERLDAIYPIPPPLSAE